jgi:hypothetical protein
MRYLDEYEDEYRFASIYVVFKGMLNTKFGRGSIWNEN